LILTVILIVLFALLVTGIWGRYSLSGLEYKRFLQSNRLFWGERVNLIIEITNKKVLPLPAVIVEDEFPEDIVLLKGRLSPHYLPRRKILGSILSLNLYEKVTRKYPIEVKKRGIFTIGPVKICASDIFGLVKKEIVVKNITEIIVYPKIVPLKELKIFPEFPTGDQIIKDWLYEDLTRFKGIKEYSAGDSFKRIAWKASARTGKLHTKVYEATVRWKVAVMLNVNTYEYLWEGINTDLLELLIVVAASISYFLIDSGLKVSMVINGGIISRVPEGHGIKQLKFILEELARVFPMSRIPAEQFLLEEGASFSDKTEIIFITGIMNDNIKKALDALTGKNKRISLVFVGDRGKEEKLELPHVKVFYVSGEAKWDELNEIKFH
jgi:uncharacterized protein (DUF58 family)